MIQTGLRFLQRRPHNNKFYTPLINNSTVQIVEGVKRVMQKAPEKSTVDDGLPVAK